MVVIPAIDIKEGRCVRLKQGRMTDETVFSEVPEEMAVKWFKQGAERLHIIDLDGAVQGRPVNNLTIKRIVNAIPIPIQLGGGVRDMDVLEAYYNIGIHYMILGTMAYKDPEFVMQACDRFPGRIILGIDAKKDRVAVEGWTEEIDSSPVELAKKFEATGVTSIIYTDIHRDGMRTGPNVDATRALARAVEIPVIASGGISGISDVLEILTLSEDGVVGMITGRALYDGSLDLAEAIVVCRAGS
ncbi:MAG: 1-(5-phosphoribosyl)-5-[(5-phosphoribosylamino)methylideneamino]imidazole-4-carboxamide isomerase [Deltaproteobacteria bacterium]|nr:1-(5-phosphoribosyl)-5-[(5-phosphoribosylamino)methylideneamino]imidazole-4-carboxamide isomerase [Deltaproteobacteria bacterium]MBW1737383.1 1-(5-phosphoribosyl)-5-[(5-phosphoribosylamino)methylideneamino]imidazole-4-carboxamide isomerase [Deltaproteobacteria bacterium]MBW2034494.1 1-(5-phosphoribosyl)-5-[(5-phosphoribosylamino)methylideneamino]imidazole-4-carboxamide isomerase [Deltaproteobacteria bacterium]MBW2169750.1 1-(5-phosphoribosyl)-5-[(5-phosphoribosylamino)methylideneamino]imidazo